MATSGWVIGLKVGLSADATWDVYQEAWMDDREITWQDKDEMLEYGLKMGLIWGPELAVVFGVTAAPLWGVYAIVGVGFVASYAIGGREGAEKFTEYIFTPRRWLPTIREQITDPVVTYLREDIWQDQLVEPIGEWWQHQIVDPVTESWLWNQ